MSPRCRASFALRGRSTPKRSGVCMRKGVAKPVWCYEIIYLAFIKPIGVTPFSTTLPYVGTNQSNSKYFGPHNGTGVLKG